MPTKKLTQSGLPGWFPEDFRADPDLLAAFEDDAAWHAAAGKNSVHEHAGTITGQLLNLAPADEDDEDTGGDRATADVTVDPQAMQPPGLPVPDDPDAVSMFTAHRVDDILRQLAHASERMQAARAAAADPGLRGYHCARIARHLGAALDAGHYLAANIRGHYPAEAAELDTVADTVGLAKAVSGEAKAATTAHLLETTLHELTHGSRHAEAMLTGTPDAEWEFNASHCEKHLGGAVEHAGKLAQHFRDNYPAEGKWLAGLDEITAPAGEDSGGKPDGGGGQQQHARYGKGTIAAQLAADTIGAQLIDLGIWDPGRHPRDDRGRFTAAGITAAAGSLAGRDKAGITAHDTASRDAEARMADLEKRLNDEISRASRLQEEMDREKRDDKRAELAIELCAVCAAVGLAFFTGGISLAAAVPFLTHMSLSQAPDIAKALASYRLAGSGKGRAFLAHPVQAAHATVSQVKTARRPAAIGMAGDGNTAAMAASRTVDFLSGTLTAGGLGQDQARDFAVAAVRMALARHWDAYEQAGLPPAAVIANLPPETGEEAGTITGQLPGSPAA